VRLVIRDEPAAPWHPLEGGESEAEWQALEDAAPLGARTNGPGREAEAALVEVVKRRWTVLRLLRSPTLEGRRRLRLAGFPRQDLNRKARPVTSDRVTRF
jgi:hypothetical protein